MALSRNRSRLIFGSPSQQSTTALPATPAVMALTHASLSTTAPRAVLMMMGARRRELKNFSSASRYVASGPSLVSGVWNVIISARSAISASVCHIAALGTLARRVAEHHFHVEAAGPSLNY